MAKETELGERTLQVALNAEGLVEQGAKLATLIDDARRLELSRRQVMAEFKEKLATLESEISDTGTAIRMKEITRRVECRCHFDDPAPGMLTWYRTDNGEEVESRPMTDVEKQEELPLADQLAADAELPAGLEDLDWSVEPPQVGRFWLQTAVVAEDGTPGDVQLHRVEVHVTEDGAELNMVVMETRQPFNLLAPNMLYRWVPLPDEDMTEGERETSG